MVVGFERPHVGRLLIGWRWYLLHAGPADGALSFTDETHALQILRRVEGGHAGLRAAMARSIDCGNRLDGDAVLTLAAALLVRRRLSLVPLPELALPSFSGHEEVEPAPPPPLPRPPSAPQWSGDIGCVEQPRWRGEVGARSTRWRAEITVQPGGD